jgi:hypothetical protein
MKLLLKVLLYVGAGICGAVSIWLVFCCFGVWFIGPPRDPSVTAAHDMLVRAGTTVLFFGISIVSGILLRLALEKARAIALRG